MEPIPTLEWTGRALRLLDQRELPAREVYIECGTVDELAHAIRTLTVRGAPAIGVAAAYGSVIAIDEAMGSPDPVEVALRGIRTLESTRPTAVNLFSCLSVQRDVLAGGGGSGELRERLLESADRMRREDLEASRAMGSSGAALLPPDCVLLTHCNAGGLATAGLGTALAVIYAAAEGNGVRMVYADETRPLLQGARLTAWELCRQGIPVRVQPDSAAASLLLSGEVDAVITGADRIAANGDVANKVGTYPLALAAREAGVPFYVAAPLSTFDPATPDGRGIRIEQRGGEELTSLGERVLVPEGAGCWNPAFDVTPAPLVSAIICEEGVLRQPFDRRIGELTGKWA